MNKKRGFTIVELLVVIVVIGILAAITIVSYTGLSNKATVASLQSDLAGASTQIKMYQAEYGVYPTMNASNCPTSPADSKYCLKSTTGNTLSYSSSSPFTTFTLDATKGDIKYRITNSTSPTLVAAPVLPPNTTDNGNGTYTTTIYSDTSDGIIQDYFGAMDLTTGTGSIEINTDNYENRAYQKFNISSISGTVTSARYYVYKTGGSTPYSINLIVDHIPDYGILDGSEFYAAPYASNIGTMHTPGSSGYGSIDVTSYINSDRTNSRTFSSYCLRLASSPPDFQSYNINFVESTNKPYLSVIWTP